MMACTSPPQSQNGEMQGGLTEKYLNSYTVDNPVMMDMNGIHHRPTPPAGSLPSQFGPIQASPSTSRISEEKDFDDLEGEGEVGDYEISPEIQAHNISTFLSSGSESGDEQISETVITDVYKDPLDVCMEGIEDLATGILRTGKLVLNGEAGDMTKIQPALFNLQPTDKNLSQLLPQLLQIPFFNHSRKAVSIMEDDELFEASNDEALSEGLIRLAAPVDTAIYVLLRGFCAKGARQAEELINVCLTENFIPSLNISSMPVMPPIIKFQSSSGKRSSGTFNLTVYPQGNQNKISTSSMSSGISVSSNMSTSSSSLLSNSGRDEQRLCTGRVRHNDSIMEEAVEARDEGTASPTITPRSPPRSPGSRSPGSPYTGTRSHPSLTKSFSSGSAKGRKTSVVQPPLPLRSNSTESEASIGEGSRYVPGVDHWNTSIMDNNTIIAQYGELAYPIVWWNPTLKVEFRMSTSVGLLSHSVAGIDREKPEVTLRVFNKSPKRIGFSIRSNRQSTVFKSHVVFPTKGLEAVEPYKSWEDTVEFYPSSADIVEMFVIDLFVCTLDSKPSWNVIRKYAIMKPKKTTQDKDRKKISKRRLSILQVTGGIEQKEEILKLVISHGLQCVVKGKLNEAEIIFSHALYLPDFQRVPLKAFVFICLAVVANKRKKQGHSMTLRPVMTAADASSKLVSVCEQGPGSVRMPRTLQLVKQLKKELNVQKIVMDEHKSKKIANSVVSKPKAEDKMMEENVPPSGRVLAFKDTVVVIPQNAVKEDTLVSVSSFDTKHLTSMLRASGWEKIVQVAVAFHIETSSTSSTWFSSPIHIDTPLPGDMRMGSNSLVRLMHSNYLRHWVDITEDVCSKVSINSASSKLEIETNLTGWLAVSIIEFDASMIAQMVLKYVSVEPAMFQFSVFAFLDVERESMQVAVYVLPCKPSGELLYKDFNKPTNFIPISFPHVIQAYPNEKLQVDIQGRNFEPDRQNGEESLTFDMEVHQKHNEILTKWVKLMSLADHPICGKIKVSRENGATGWDTIAHLNLSTVSASIPSASSSSEQ